MKFSHHFVGLGGLGLAIINMVEKRSTLCNVMFVPHDRRRKPQLARIDGASNEGIYWLLGWETDDDVCVFYGPNQINPMTRIALYSLSCNNSKTIFLNQNMPVNIPVWGNAVVALHVDEWNMGNITKKEFDRFIEEYRKQGIK